MPEVVHPDLSTIVLRMSGLPQSPQVPKKKPFGPATAIASRHLEVMETLQLMFNTPVEAPPVIDADDILIPGPCVHALMEPTEQPMSGLQQARVALHHLDTIKAPSTTQLKAQMCSQLCGPSSTPSVSGVTTPQMQTCSHSKTITAVKAPAPAPAHKSPELFMTISPYYSLVAIASSSSAVPPAALNVPMLDLHAISMAIRGGAAQITTLEACVVEQGAIPESMSPPELALPPLIDLLMAGMEPTLQKFRDSSVIEGLVFELSQVQHYQTCCQLLRVPRVLGKL
ncbi:uncharacterized protein BJ212DRAFT_1299229 [Suillus subaureus]|uniref:Uncharacterized protein n=1 Tax=Suillus subaureus TaxID=48587 RepID=A0A9P7EBG7_9AGAM|nr:uncharacterized protein BJ212DRAFT_1299229 [Suillus subaureus]KAG1817039.1 hypothetical protein BJ212DRAFT_1299229 [Suillus subaureus]